MEYELDMGAPSYIPGRGALYFNDAYPFKRQVSPGDTLYMQAKVQNSTSYTKTAYLTYNIGEPVTTDRKDIPPGEEALSQTQIDYDILENITGQGEFDFFVELDNGDSYWDGTVQVGEPFSASDLSITTCDTDVFQDTIDEDGEMSFNAYVENNNSQDADVDVRWYIEGTEIVGATETVWGNDSSTIDTGPITGQQIIDAVGYGTHDFTAEIYEAAPEGTIPTIP